MKNDQTILPLDLHHKNLGEINGVKFTRREVDVIAFILNGRTAVIAGFLLIGKRAVETYIRNIKQKAGGLTGRDQIIDFIEKSGKLSLLKNEYYSALRLHVLFEEKLNAIPKKLDIKSSTCILVYEKVEKYKPSIIPYLKEHLKRIGFEVRTYPCEEEAFFTHPNEILNLEQINHVLYIFPDNLSDAQIAQINTNHLSKVVFLLHQNTPLEDVYKKLKNINYINVLEKENYYLSFFEILKKLLPHNNFESLVEEFKQQAELINESFEVTTPQEDFKAQEEAPGPPANKNFLRERKWYFLVGFIAVMSALSVGLFIITEKPKDEVMVAPSIPQPSGFPIRSDLIIPHHNVLLARPEIMAELDKHLRGKDGIKTVAIVGTGGAGKTTLTRQYAHQQKEKIIWEMNAESQESIKGSVEKLAQKLSMTERDKEEFRDIQNIMDVIAREEKILQFVKERLKLYSNWFLLYDNVENLIDIANYFPQDPKTWGEGKIIITTRNNNIKNNAQISHVIAIGELSQVQKRDLFRRIIAFGSNCPSDSIAPEEETAFLKHIPPFPLDISVAAYYIKTTNISYASYLEHLDKLDDEFASVQKELLKEAGTYLKTRYSIITLTLENIIKNHKDFSDLFLLISLLDSQNIPRDLLDKYKNKAIVDSFIYHLKKHSFITSEVSPSTSEYAFSLHRSAQAISLAYLRKKLNLDNNKALIQSTGKILENYLNNLFENWNTLKLKDLGRHCEIFLSHGDLLADSLKGSLSIKLGGIYTIDYSTFSPVKAKNFLEKTIEVLNKNKSKNYDSIAQGLYFLGFNSWDMGEYEKCKFFCEKSIEIYKKYIPENQLGLARSAGLLAFVTLVLGHYEESKDLVEQALSIYRQYYPENHVNIAWCLSFLGCSYYYLGYYEKAKEIHEKCLSIYKEYYPKNYMSMCRIYLGLGLVHRRLKHYEQAKYYVEEAIAIGKSKFSKLHYCTECCLIALGVIYIDLHEYEKAKKIFENGLVFHEKHYGKNHFHNANILRDLGKLYLIENNIEKAEALFKRSLSIFQKTKHVEIYTTLESFADLCLKKSLLAYQKDLQQSEVFKNQAIDYLKQALEVVKTRFPAGSPHREPIELKLKELE